MKSPAQHEIIVVGGGPVGAAAMLALRQAGFDVALLDRAPPPRPFDAADYDLRVYALAPVAQRVLDALGVWPAIAAARVSPYAAMRVWQRDPQRPLKFDANELAKPQLGWIVEHGLIVARLWQALQAAPVHSGAVIESAQFDEAGARLQLSDGRALEARLVIAADGADSQLRQLAGIEVLAWRYAHTAVVCHVQTARPHRGTAWQRFLQTGPLAFLPLADGRSSIVWSADEPCARELLALDDSAFCERLAQASQGVLGDITGSTRRVSFPLRFLHAQDYVRPALALAGDAAHTVHPLAGQGVNLGLADAQALVQVLREARDAGRDWAAPRNLARYARARKPANLEMLSLTDGLYRAFRLSAPGLRTALGLGMEAVDRLGPIKNWLARQATG
jgi:ubiquinone biosynthesis UbiH/UbiF/VisC/COQ6 family hydroxylase